MEFIIILGLPALAIFMAIFMMKKITKNMNKRVQEFLSKKNTTLEKELQTFINSIGNNSRVQEVRQKYSFKYSNNELIGIIIKLKLEGDNT